MRLPLIFNFPFSLPSIFYCAAVLFLATSYPVKLLATPTQKVIKLGVTAPLTGNLASYGVEIQRGVELAVADANAEGIPAESVVEDTPVAGAGVMTVLNDLLQQKRVLGIAGNFSNVAMLAMAPQLARSKTIAMHTSALDDDILAAAPGYVFSSNIQIRDEATEVAYYLRQEGFRRIGLFSVNTSFGNGYVTGFKESGIIPQANIVAAETHELSDSYFKTQVARILAAKPDAIFAATFSHYLGTFMRQLKESGFTGTVISVYEAEDDSVLEAAKGAAEGLLLFVGYPPDTELSGSQTSFLKRYQAAYHRAPGSFARHAYDGTRLLINALHDCKNDIPCAQQQLYAICDYPGVSGTLSIKPNGAASKKLYLKSVRNNKFSYLGKTTASNETPLS